MDEARIRAEKKVDRSIHLRDLKMQDRNFQTRDENLYNHRSEINNRGIKMEKYFQNPAIVTHTKQEVIKNGNVQSLQGCMGKMEAMRESDMEK